MFAPFAHRPASAGKQLVGYSRERLHEVLRIGAMTARA
jgi:hypothetical protein